MAEKVKKCGTEVIYQPGEEYQCLRKLQKGERKYAVMISVKKPGAR